MSKKEIQVTKTYLPPLEEYQAYVEKIWESGWITNNGQLIRELEEKLQEYLGVKHVILIANGTLALQILYKALQLKGEVITTPFSYVATTSSLVWEGLKPVFADIQPDTLCMDPKKVEEAISPDTSAIVATHVYGNPCDVEQLQEIADRKGLRLIYDAAHAFGVKYQGESVLRWGDAATLSFHATKLFHTVEGGAIVTEDDEIARVCEYMRRFGHDGPYAYHGVGINAKLTEFQAAMGLCILPRIEEIIEARQRIIDRYRENLAGSDIKTIELHPECSYYNGAYMPVLFPDEASLLRAERLLEEVEVKGRRYFYPSLSKLNYVEASAGRVPVAEELAPRVLCLPLYPDLEMEAVDRVAEGILRFKGRFPVSTFKE